jgi:hypothetical protein
MTLVEILVGVFFLAALFIPKRSWRERWDEFKANIIFALVFPLAMQPIWSYEPESWTVFLSHTPVFIMLYWLAFIPFSLNFSDWILKTSLKRKPGDRSPWLFLLADMIIFGLFGMIWEILFITLGVLEHKMGTAFGSLGPMKIPLILLFGYIGLAVFGGQAFRLKKKAGIL